jgi:hypothetical protein
MLVDEERIRREDRFPQEPTRPLMTGRGTKRYRPRVDGGREARRTESRSSLTYGTLRMPWLLRRVQPHVPFKTLGPWTKGRIASTLQPAPRNDARKVPSAISRAAHFEANHIIEDGAPDVASTRYPVNIVLGTKVVTPLEVVCSERVDDGEVLDTLGCARDPNPVKGSSFGPKCGAAVNTHTTLINVHAYFIGRSERPRSTARKHEGQTYPDQKRPHSVHARFYKPTSVSSSL